MEWRDQGFITAARKHGESSLIIEVLTLTHGRFAGYVKGGAVSKKLQGVVVLGNEVHTRWSARLEEQLGNYQVELATAHAVRLLDDALALLGLNVLCALAKNLPEREPHPKIHQAFAAMIEALAERENWCADLCRFELLLLQELGYGLDSAQLETLPAFLFDLELTPTKKETAQGLESLGEFLMARIYEPRGLTLPLVRTELLTKITLAAAAAAAAAAS